MSADSVPVDPEAAAARIAALEKDLEACRAVIGNLRLQLDLLSTTDAVTGLPNVQGIIDLIESVVARFVRSGEPFGLMMVHIPELNEIRRHSSHESHREALRHAAGLVVAALRQVDRVGRLDDASFIAALPGTEEEGALAVVERLRRLLRSMALGLEDREVRFSPEIALVFSAPEAATDPMVLLDLLHEARQRATFDDPVILHAPPVAGDRSE